MKRLVGLVVLALAVSSAQAQVWNEVGEAPDFPSPGQVTVGAGPLTTINGNLQFSGDADMYCIIVTDPVNFSATTSGSAIFDTQLFLFDLNGLGITHNDDDPASASGTQSSIGAGGPGPGVGPIPVGHYGLAVSAFDTDPINPGGAEIWADFPYDDETAPDGAGGPLAGWSRDPFAETGNYTITLVGATFCDIPEPASIALLVLGGLALVRRR